MWFLGDDYKFMRPICSTTNDLELRSHLLGSIPGPLLHVPLELLEGLVLPDGVLDPGEKK